MLGDLTLGEATELLRGPGWACACVGPIPGSGALCACKLYVSRAADLRRAAHIVARQISDLRARSVRVEEDNT